MLNQLNAWLQTFASTAQTTLGWIALLMVIIFALGVVYYVVAWSLSGIWPQLYHPVSGDWVKSTALVWLIGTASLGGLWVLITQAIASGGYKGLGN